MTQNKSSNISVTLVEPQGDWNIGAVARAMKNFGLIRLKLVNPAKYETEKCYTAAIAARDIIDAAHVYPTLDEAVADDVFVVGLSRRMRHISIPVYDLADAVPQIMDMAGKGALTLMFGSEADGLTNEQLSRADMVVNIPTSPLFASLNLSQAVILVCYELYKISDRPVRESSYEFVTKDRIEPVLEQLEKALGQLDYDNRGDGKLLYRIMNKFRHLFGRAGMEESDVNMLMGVATRILEKLPPKSE
jgi:TrmH family RNA methyltransferase